MSAVPRDPSSHPYVSGQLRTTHWSMVLAAGNDAAENKPAALELLCRTYWDPLYVFVRRKGYPLEDAKDLVQAFFAQLLAKDGLATVAPAKGKFRTFLLTSMTHFLANEWDRSHRLKRGGGQQIFSLDSLEGAERCIAEPADLLSPEVLFERRWANTIVDSVMSRLAAEFEAAAKEGRFQILQGFLLGESQFNSYAEAAAALGVSEQAVKGAVHRLRRRFGELLREEVGQTLAEPGAVEEEIRSLLAAWRR